MLGQVIRVAAQHAAPLTTDMISAASRGPVVGAAFKSSLRGLFGSNWTIKTEYLLVDLGCSDRTLPNLGLTFSTPKAV